jgi:uncharacterized protein (DUF39 family)
MDEGLFILIRQADFVRYSIIAKVGKRVIKCAMEALHTARGGVCFSGCA